MAKAKKSSSSSSSGAKFFSFRMIDGVLLLLLGCVSALSMYLYQGIRKDIDVLVQNQHVFKNQLVPRIGEEIDSLRSSMRDLNTRLSAPKKTVAPPHAVKGKRSAWNTEDQEEPSTVEVFNDILNKYKSINSRMAKDFSGRVPASVNGEDNGKTVGWVVSQIGMWLSWLLVLFALVVLIMRMIDQGPGQKDP